MNLPTSKGTNLGFTSNPVWVPYMEGLGKNPNGPSPSKVSGSDLFHQSIAGSEHSPPKTA